MSLRTPPHRPKRGPGGARAAREDDADEGQQRGAGEQFCRQHQLPLLPPAAGLRARNAASHSTCPPPPPGTAPPLLALQPIPHDGPVILAPPWSGTEALWLDAMEYIRVQEWHYGVLLLYPLLEHGLRQASPYP